MAEIVREKIITEKSMPVIPGLDTALGISRIGGKPSSYLVVMKSFCASYKKKLSIMKEMFENNDIHNLTIDCHALKSALASIGAIALSHKAAGMENAGASKDIAYLRENFIPFLNELEEFNGKLNDFFNENSGSASKKNGTDQLLCEKIETVLEAVRNLENDEAAEIIDELKGYTFSEETDKKIELISECLACFDDMRAEEICEGLLA